MQDPFNEMLVTKIYSFIDSISNEVFRIHLKLVSNIQNIFDFSQ